MWVWYSLFVAIWGALQTFLVKKLTKKINSLTLLYVLFLFNIPISFALLLFMGGIPKTTGGFYLYLEISGFLDAIAFVCSFWAISRSSISLIAPISSFSPVFTTIIAAFTINEIPTPIKLVGILLIVFGAYLLNAADIRSGILNPFKVLFSNKSVLLFLLAHFLWGFTPILQKKAIFETQPQVPLFAAIVGMIFVFLYLSPFALRKTLSSFREISVNLKWFVINGIGNAFAQAAAFAAFALAYLGYATSVFRLSVFFTIILGGVFLKEERIKERLLGGAVMVIGTILLAL